MSQHQHSLSAQPLPIVVLGHVDHGKSTIIGRLLHDTGLLAEGKAEALGADSARRGMAVEWSFALDSLQAERDHGITIDVSHIRFATARRPYVIIDAPGHKEFLRNMVTGASLAEAAVLVVDAAEGLREQTRRHAYLVKLLGIEQVILLINKIDLVDRDRARIEAVAAEAESYLARLGLAVAATIPAAARHGEQIAARGPGLDWYDGPTLVEALDALPDARTAAERPLRLPVQDVYKFDHRRLVVGRIESGRLKVGDTLEFSPGGKRARIASIESWNTPAPVIAQRAGQSVALTLDDEIFVERGQVAHRIDSPAAATTRLTGRTFWLGAAPLAQGARLRLRVGTAEVPVRVAAIERVVDVEHLTSGTGDAIPTNGFASILLEAAEPIAADPFAAYAVTGRGVLLDGPRIAGGIIFDQVAEAPVIVPADHQVTLAERAAVAGHQPGVFWLTGLSGAGKSTLAMAAERLLFDRGRRVVVLDGDALRRRVNSDLGFDDASRRENVRRIAEIAGLLRDQGSIVLVPVIAPFAADRALARAIVGAGFHEIHVAAPLAACEERDPKGLYRRARAGEIPGFTGIASPYEVPTGADLILDTAAASRERCTEDLVAYVERATRPASHRDSTHAA